MSNKEEKEIIDSNVVISNGRARKREYTTFGKIMKWWPLYVYLLFMVAIFIFIASGDKKLPYEAYYKNGTSIVVIGDTDYKLLSIDDKKEYIGSFVSTKLHAEKQDQIARIKSYLLYVSSYYSIQGSENLDYVLDGKFNVYVKADMLEEAKAYFDDVNNISYYMITSKMKDMTSMTKLSDGFVEKLADSDPNEVVIDDIVITENFENRREIYGFYDNDIFCKACYELFKYKGDIYITTKMVDKSANKGVAVLRGRKIPSELAKEVAGFWD